MRFRRHGLLTRSRFVLGFVFLAAEYGWTPMIGQVRSFPNEPGWEWQVRPQSANNSVSSANSLVLMLGELKNGEALVTIAYSESSIQDMFALRAVGFDELNRRYEFEPPTGGGSNGVNLSAFRLPAERLPRDRLKYVGIEKLTNDSLRLVISPKAGQSLKDKGEQALNYPQIGKPYVFRLKTMDGSILSSGNYLGKVILVDFWASWCTPCMAKMPRLKETYQTLRGRGFEVIGINHDNSIQDANRVLSKEKLPWPEVLAPMGEKGRKLWNVAAGITSLPRLWLIDRKGIMRADVSVRDLEGEIRKLVDE